MRIILVLLAAPLLAHAQLKHAIDENPGGPEGPYRAPLIRAIKGWPGCKLAFDPARAGVVQLVAFETEGHPHAIGVGQVMRVDAPIAAVKKVVEDFDNYKKLFFNFEDVQLVARDGNRVVTAWEENIPIPFVPNSKYSTYFIIDDRDPKRVFYRYQLKEGSSLIYSDGMIVLEKAGENATTYTEYDFYDAHWGVAATLGPNQIWEDSARDIYYTDIAIKLKAEHPDWSYDKVKDESEKNFKAHSSMAFLEKKQRLTCAK